MTYNVLSGTLNPPPHWVVAGCLQWPASVIPCVHSDSCGVCELFCASGNRTFLHLLDSFPTSCIVRLLHFHVFILPFPPLDNVWAMMIVWRIRGRIITTVLCWIAPVHMHTDMSSSYRSSVLGLGFCVLTRASLFVLGLVFLCWCISSLLLFGCQYQCNQLPGKTRPWNDLLCIEWDVKPYTFTYLLMQWHMYSKNSMIATDTAAVRIAGWSYSECSQSVQ